MNLQIVKDHIQRNNVFDTMDDSSGSLQVPTGNFNNFEYGPSVFFGEGEDPPAVTTKTETWDTVPKVRLLGKTEDEIAKNYLKAFYYWLLMKLPLNQSKLQGKSINNNADIENLFTGLPSMYTSETCLLTVIVSQWVNHLSNLSERPLRTLKS